MTEDVVQHEDHPLERGKALQDHEEGEAHRFGQLGCVLTAADLGGDGLRKPRSHIGFALDPRRAQDVDAQVGADRRQPGGGVLDGLLVGRGPARERLLHGVLGLAGPS